MNLWLRILHVILTSFFRPRLEPTDVSRLRYRVWPHDLDLSMHMNNGRYWTIMDLGRADLMLRTGVWRAMLRNGWSPIVNAGKIRFRRELRLFQPFTLETRILTWGDNFLVMEHRIVSRSAKGEEIVNAIALTRACLYDRKARRFVTTKEIFAVVGNEIPAPTATPEVEAFLAAEEAMKRAA
jgi:acyl-CoA thioesterase FadM